MGFPDQKKIMASPFKDPGLILITSNAHCIGSDVHNLVSMRILNIKHLARGIASLTVPGVQKFHFPRFSSNFQHFF